MKLKDMGKAARLTADLRAIDDQLLHVSEGLYSLMIGRLTRMVADEGLVAAVAAPLTGELRARRSAVMRELEALGVTAD